MEMLHNAINWVEIPVADFARAKKFYSAIYDYEMPEMPMGPITMGFLLHDRDNGGVGGAIVFGEGYTPGTGGPKVYLNGGTDLNTVLNRVEAAGGKVILSKIPIGDGSMGHIGIFEDTEGNHISLHSMQ
jgi:uncharacterized protein